MKTNIRVTICEIGRLTYSSPWHFETEWNIAILIDFERFVDDDLAKPTSCKNLNFGSVTPKF